MGWVSLQCARSAHAVRTQCTRSAHAVQTLCQSVVQWHAVAGHTDRRTDKKKPARQPDRGNPCHPVLRVWVNMPPFFELPALELPELPELNDCLGRRARTDRPVVAVTVVASVGLFVLGQTARQYLRYRRKRALAREAHTRRIRSWVRDLNEQIAMRQAEGEETEFEPDSDAAYVLWLRGNELGCSAAVLQLVTEVLGNIMQAGALECIDRHEEDFSYRDRLMAIKQRVEEMGLQGRFGPLWPRVTALNRRIWAENFALLGGVMQRSGFSRLCRLAVTVVVAYFTEWVASASAEAYDNWTEHVAERVAIDVALKWGMHYLVMGLLEGVVDTLGTRVTMYLSSEFKRRTDRELYTNLVRQDTAFFDAHTAEEIEQLSTITDDLQNADDRLHRTVRRLVQDTTRLRTLWRADRRLCATVFGVYLVYQAVSKASSRVVELFNIESEQATEDSTLAGTWRLLPGACRMHCPAHTRWTSLRTPSAYCPPHTRRPFLFGQSLCSIFVAPMVMAFKRAGRQSVGWGRGCTVGHRCARDACAVAPPRPLLSGWLILYTGGGVRGQKKVCVPKIDLKVRAPLINFIFFLRKNFLMWVGG